MGEWIETCQARNLEGRSSEVMAKEPGRTRDTFCTLLSPLGVGPQAAVMSPTCTQVLGVRDASGSKERDAQCRSGEEVTAVTRGEASLQLGVGRTAQECGRWARGDQGQQACQKSLAGFYTSSGKEA